MTDTNHTNPADNPECAGCDSLQPYVTVHEPAPQPEPEPEQQNQE